MIPLIPIITRAGAMLLMKQMAKRAAKKKILKDAALKKKVDKIGKKAAKKERKKESEAVKEYREHMEQIRWRNSPEGKKYMTKKEADRIYKSGEEKLKKAAKKEAKKTPKKRIMAIGKLKGKLSTKQVAARQKLRDDVKKYRN